MLMPSFFILLNPFTAYQLRHPSVLLCIWKLKCLSILGQDNIVCFIDVLSHDPIEICHRFSPDKPDFELHAIYFPAAEIHARTASVSAALIDRPALAADVVNPPSKNL